MNVRKYRERFSSKSPILAAAVMLSVFSVSAAWHDRPTVKATIDLGYGGTADPHYLSLSQEGTMLATPLYYGTANGRDFGPLKLWNVGRLAGVNGTMDDCAAYTQDYRAFAGAQYAWKGCAVSESRGVVVPCPGNGLPVGRTYALRLDGRPWRSGESAFTLDFGIAFDSLAFSRGGDRLISNGYASGTRHLVYVWPFETLSADQTMTPVGDPFDTGLQRVRNLSLYSVGGAELLYVGEGDSGNAPTKGLVRVIDMSTSPWTASDLVATELSGDITNIKIARRTAGGPTLYVMTDGGELAVYTLAADGKSAVGHVKTFSADETAVFCGLSATPPIGKFRNFEVTDDGLHAFFMYGTADDAGNPDGKAELTVVATRPSDEAILLLGCDKVWENEATAAGRLSTVAVSPASVLTEGAVSATIKDGMNGPGKVNGGYVYSTSNVSGAWSGAAAYTSGDFTYECFIRVDPSSSMSYLACHAGAWMLQINGNRVVLKDNGWGYVAASPVVNDGIWHHLAVVQDRKAGMMSLYFDYRLAGTKAYLAPATAGDTLIINGYQNNNGVFNNYSTKVAFDEVRLVPRALDVAEFATAPELLDKPIPDGIVDADTLMYVSGSIVPSMATGEMNELRARDARKPSLSMSGYYYFTREPALVQAELATGALNCDAAFKNEHLLQWNNASSASLAMSDLSVFSDSFTLEFWFGGESFEKMSSNPDAGTNIYFADLPGFFYFRQNKLNGTVSINLSGAEAPVQRNMIDGRLHHYAAVWDKPSKTLTAYVDHVLFMSKTLDSDPVPTGALRFGATARWGGASGVLYWLKNGWLDEVRLTSRVLGAEEMLSRGAVGAASSETIAYVPFDTAPAAGVNVNALTAPGKPPVVLTYNGAAPVRADPGGIPALFPAAVFETSYTNARAYHFTEAGRLTVSDVSYLDDSFTVEFFFRADDSSKIARDGDDVYLVMQPGLYFIRMGVILDGRVVVNNSKTDKFIADRYLADGAWHHYAVVWDKPACRMLFYIDHQVVLDETLAEGVSSNGADALLFGAGHWGNANTHIIKDGWYDEIRISSRALSPCEFLTPVSLAEQDPVLFARGEDGTYGGIAGRYAFSAEASGDVSLSLEARTGSEIRDSRGEKLFDNRRGIALNGGTVTYDGKGALNARSATVELFLKGIGSGAVLTCAADCDSDRLLWRFLGDGVLEIRTSDRAEPTAFRLPGCVPGDGKIHHFALSYAADAEGMEVKAYWDHKEVFSRDFAAGFDLSSPIGLILGSAAFTGAVDELRMCRGVQTPDDMLYAHTAGLMILVR